MKKVENFLREVRSVFKTEGDWTRVEYARDNKGLPVSFSSLSAVSWCLTGALNKVLLKKLEGGKEWDECLRTYLDSMALICDQWSGLINDDSEWCEENMLPTHLYLTKINDDDLSEDMKAEWNEILDDNLTCFERMIDLLDKSISEAARRSI